jgi:hypothetical protein
MLLKVADDFLCKALSSVLLLGWHKSEKAIE